MTSSRPDAKPAQMDAASHAPSDVILADETFPVPLGQLPLVHADGSLPGKDCLYALRNGQGEHYLLGGQVASIIARPVDTGGDCSTAILCGSLGAGLPLHRHEKTDKAIYVMKGRLELHLDGQTHLLTEGDYAYIPAGTVHGYRMKSWRTRFVTWAIGDGLGAFWQSLGMPFSRSVQPENPDLTIADEKFKEASARSDVIWMGNLPDESGVLVTQEGIPDQRKPYVVMAGGGENLVAADQLFSFLQTDASSAGGFLTVLTEGPTGDPIPWHYHRHHTENFFCLEGQMTMWLNGQEVHLNPGDYCQVTPGTVHSYRCDSPYTKFIGWLIPTVFEPFFRYVGDPTDMRIFPVVPPEFRFDRVQQHIGELDLNVMLVRP